MGVWGGWDGGGAIGNEGAGGSHRRGRWGLGWMGRGGEDGWVVGEDGMRGHGTWDLGWAEGTTRDGTSDEMGAHGCDLGWGTGTSGENWVRVN